LSNKNDSVFSLKWIKLDFYVLRLARL